MVHVRVGLERLEGRATGEPSAIDRGILDAAHAAGDTIQLTVFRGTNGEGTGSWAMEEALSDADAVRLARHMLVAQLHVYRGLLREGLALHLHCDFLPRDAEAYRTAARALAAELEGRRVPGEHGPHDDALAVDAWILQHLTFFFAVRLETLMTTILPDKLTMMERRTRRFEDLLARWRATTP
jgi:hypothetical protein